MPTIVTKQASENPILFYKHFLENTVLTHPELFANLTALGEAITGVGLTLGLLHGGRVAGRTGPGHELRAGHAVDVAGPARLSPGALALMIAFFFSRAGRTWGLDARLWTARPDVPARATPVLVSAPGGTLSGQ